MSTPRSTTSTLSGHTKKVHCVAWNRSGDLLASGSVDMTARLWKVGDSASGKEVGVLRGHKDNVDQLCWDPSSDNQLATTSGDKTVMIWDSRVQKRTQSIATPGENINITWSPDGRYIAVGNKEDYVSMIDTRTWKIKTKQKFPYEVNEMAWDNSGKRFFLTTHQRDSKMAAGTIEVKAFNDGVLTADTSIYGHTANIYCIDFDPVGRYFATGGADALVSIWSLGDFCCRRTLARLDWPVRTLSFSFDGRLIASASEDEEIDVADVESGRQVIAIPVRAPLNTVQWHPKKYLLAYAGDDRNRDDQYEGTIKVTSIAMPAVA